MTKVIDYCNGSNSEGIQFYYGKAGQQMQVYISCKVLIEYEFKAYTHRDDRAQFGDGQIVIDWKNSGIIHVDGITVDLLNRDGRLIFTFLDHNWNKREEKLSKVEQVLNLPIDESDTTVREAVMDAIESDGPDQDSDSCWVEAIAHSEAEARDEAMAEKYLEKV